MPPPTITSLSASEGPQAGGNPLVVTGTNLDTATDLDFLDAGTSPLSFTVDGPTQLTVASMPAHAKAIGVILVTTPLGNASSDDTYAYDDSSTDPRVTSLTPNSGPIAGGTSVAIHGERFTGATAVDFGFTPATSFSVDSDSIITAEAPSTGFAHGVYVKVTAGGEDNPNGIPNVYAYTAAPPDPPVIDSRTPSSGFVGGGTTVHLVGSNFGGTYDVQIDGVSVGYSQFDNEHIDITTEPHAAGTGFTIAVFCDGGEADATFDFVETPDPPPPTELEACIALSIGDFLADTITADANAICYTVESIAGWFDSPPLRVGQSESQPRGEHVNVVQTLGRTVVVVLTAHTLDRQTPLGRVLCFTSMETIKAAFRVVFVPAMMRVVDPVFDRQALVRRDGPIKQQIIGESAVVRFSIPLFAEVPELVDT